MTRHGQRPVRANGRRWLVAALGAFILFASTAAVARLPRVWKKSDIRKKQKSIEQKAAGVKKILKAQKKIGGKDSVGLSRSQYKAAMKALKAESKGKRAAVAQRERAYKKLFSADQKWQRAQQVAALKFNVAATLGSNRAALRTAYKDGLKKDAAAYNKALTSFRAAEKQFTRYTGKVRGLEGLKEIKSSNLVPAGFGTHASSNQYQVFRLGPSYGNLVLRPNPSPTRTSGYDEAPRGSPKVARTVRAAAYDNVGARFSLGNIYTRPPIPASLRYTGPPRKPATSANTLPDRTPPQLNSPLQP